MLILEMCHKYEGESHSVMSDSLQPQGLYSPWNSPGQNTGMGSLSLLQGIFATQGLNPVLPHRRQILYQLSHRGSPKERYMMLTGEPNLVREVRMASLRKRQLGSGLKTVNEAQCGGE